MPAVSVVSMGLVKMALSVQMVLLGASTASVTPVISLPTSSMMRTPSMAWLAVKVNTVLTPVCTLYSGVSNLINWGGSVFFRPSRLRPPSTTLVEIRLALPRMPVAPLGIRK